MMNANIKQNITKPPTPQALCGMPISSSSQTAIKPESIILLNEMLDIVVKQANDMMTLAYQRSKR